MTSALLVPVAITYPSKTAMSVSSTSRRSSFIAMSGGLLNGSCCFTVSLTKPVRSSSPNVGMAVKNRYDARLRQADLFTDFGLSPAVVEQEGGDFLEVHAPIISNLIGNVKQKADVFTYQNAVMETFGERLKACRKEAKLSQIAAAKKVGVSQGLISDLENNVYDSSAKTIELAYIYRVNPYWLATGKGDRKDAALTSQERELLSDFRRLPDPQRGIALIGVKWEGSKIDASELAKTKPSDKSGSGHSS